MSRIIQIISHGEKIYGLDEEGTLWVRYMFDTSLKHEWVKLSESPKKKKK